ncbi:MAG: hypothetical protein HKL96_12730 [Phycisphaerales bacterium]|nr:hypothetical protein [Phycisphaerales bacterium]
MLKLIAAMAGFLLMAAVLLGLRQQQINLTSQCAHLYSKILSRQHILWDQQTQIAANTNTMTLTRRLARQAAATQAAAGQGVAATQPAASGPVVQAPVAPVPLSSFARDASQSGGP